MIYYSECCGEEMNNWPDSDICPNCKEHTGVDEDDHMNYEGGGFSDIHADAAHRMEQVKRLK